MEVTGENSGFELDNKRITPDAMDSLMRNERLGRSGHDFSMSPEKIPEACCRRLVNMNIQLENCIPGWWFGTFLCLHILGIIIPTD